MGQREQYDPTRGSFRSWLLAITADQAYKTWRWNNRRRAVWSRPVDVGEPGEFVDLERALEKLPARQRLAVDCFYFAGLSVAETASVMKCSDGTVKSTLAAARRNLHGLLR
jgi:RNA polymerase sigma-70 factor (ECF subfamily)